MTRDMPFPTPQVDPETAERYLPVAARGVELLKTTMLNKGSAFTRQEREEFGLIGTAESLASGQIYPAIADVRSTSLKVAKAVANQAVAEGLADSVADLDKRIEEEMWFPEYLPYRPV